MNAVDFMKFRAAVHRARDKRYALKVRRIDDRYEDPYFNTYDVWGKCSSMVFRATGCTKTYCGGEYFHADEQITMALYPGTSEPQYYYMLRYGNLWFPSHGVDCDDVKSCDTLEECEVESVKYYYPKNTTVRPLQVSLFD